MDKSVTSLGVASLALGLVSFVLFPVVTAIFAILFGAMSAKEDSLGTAGVVIGIASIIFTIYRISTLF